MVRGDLLAGSKIKKNPVLRTKATGYSANWIRVFRSIGFASKKMVTFKITVYSQLSMRGLTNLRIIRARSEVANEY
jgi:N-acetylglutamate synthase/N-acetylornithine aminotransferase